MNKRRRAISIVSITLAIIMMTTLMIGSIAFAAPTSDMLVMDTAKMLTKEEEEKIESALLQIYKQTGIEFVIYTAPSLNGQTIEEASLDIGRSLGIGNRTDKTGLLIYVALEDREFRMEVGYGLEGVIPDSIAKKIIDCMTPYFKEANYADGLLAAVTETVNVLNKSGEYTITQDEEYVVESKSDSPVSGVILLVIIIIIFVYVEVVFDNGHICRSSGGGYSSGISHSSSSGSFGGGSFGGGGASGGW